LFFACHSSALKMEVACPPKRLFQRHTLRYVQGDRTLPNDLCENLKSFSRIRHIFINYVV
jgi:hypothetical protein